MRAFLIILGGFFLTMLVLSTLGAIDFRVCVGEPGTCIPKTQ